MKPVRYLPIDFLRNRLQRLDAQRRTVVPTHADRAVIVVAAARGSAQPPALRVFELYQGLVRPFQRRGKAYELRCGQLSARTIAAFADQR
jgi:hypothetical protein